MNFQKGQQLLVKTDIDNLAHQIRITHVTQNGYVIQRIGHINFNHVNEETLQRWIDNVDRR